MDLSRRSDNDGIDRRHVHSRRPSRFVALSELPPDKFVRIRRYHINFVRGDSDTTRAWSPPILPAPTSPIRMGFTSHIQDAAEDIHDAVDIARRDEGVHRKGHDLTVTVARWGRPLE